MTAIGDHSRAELNEVRGPVLPSGSGRSRSLLRSALRAPLTVKLAGANVAAAALAAGATIALRDAIVLDESWVVSAIVLALSIVCSVALSILALRPLRAIEATANRVLRGDYGARVPDSYLSEHSQTRVADTLNLLLDSMHADRARLRDLASQIIRAADEERANLARELHDSTAQGLAAVLFHLSALERDATDDAAHTRLGEVRLVAEEVLEEIRLLAHTLHPRVLDDLGLKAALQNLARRSTEVGTARVEVDDRVADSDAALRPHLRSVIYRVAQEAVRNALRHASPARVRIELTRGDVALRLEVMDDGAGFDVADAERRRPGMGLFTMRERLALVGGTLHVTSERGHGTRVIASLPLEPADPLGDNYDR